MFVVIIISIVLVQCLEIPLKPQYNGGIIVNPDLRDGGSLGWTPFGNAKVDFRKIGNHNFVVARDRKQPYDSVSQKVYLEKGLLYTFSGKNNSDFVFLAPHFIRFCANSKILCSS